LLFIITLVCIINPNIIRMSRNKLQKLYNTFSGRFGSKTTSRVMC
jgi:hypothetical protein